MYENWQHGLGLFYPLGCKRCNFFPSSWNYKKDTWILIEAKPTTCLHHFDDSDLYWVATFCGCYDLQPTQLRSDVTISLSLGSTYPYAYVEATGGRTSSSLDPFLWFHPCMRLTLTVDHVKLEVLKRQPPVLVKAHNQRKYKKWALISQNKKKPIFQLKNKQVLIKWRKDI